MRYWWIWYWNVSIGTPFFGGPKMPRFPIVWLNRQLEAHTRDSVRIWPHAFSLSKDAILRTLRPLSLSLSLSLSPLDPNKRVLMPHLWNEATRGVRSWWKWSPKGSHKKKTTPLQIMVCAGYQSAQEQIWSSEILIMGISHNVPRFSELGGWIHGQLLHFNSSRPECCYRVDLPWKTVPGVPVTPPLGFFIPRFVFVLGYWGVVSLGLSEKELKPPIHWGSLCCDEHIWGKERLSGPWTSIHRLPSPLSLIPSNRPAAFVAHVNPKGPKGLMRRTHRSGTPKLSWQKAEPADPRNWSSPMADIDHKSCMWTRW